MEGTVLSNGTGYENFVIDEAPDDFRVRAQMYCDSAVFEDEMRNIFEKTWVYVGHESELPEPNDFKTAAVGRIPVIVSRDDAGQIHVLLNSCRHRGSIVCRKERGNAKHFVCPYHAWVYGVDGKLLNTSIVGGGYREGFDERIGGLVRLPRVATYRGMIFASVAPKGESLEDYLGLARRYIDLWFDQSPTGRIKVLAPRRGYYDGNWKFQVENTTDGWHARFVHDSAFKTMRDFSKRRMGAWKGCTRGFEHGHGILERPNRTNFPGDTHERYMKLLDEAHGKERADLVHNTRHITLFPTVHLMDFKIRIVQPVSVTRTIIYEHPINIEGAPDEINEVITRRLASEGSVVAGFVNSDDVEIFGRVQSGLYGAHLLEWLVMARGMGEEQTAETGELVGEENYELPQRAIYREWSRLMNAGA